MDLEIDDIVGEDGQSQGEVEDDTCHCVLETLMKKPFSSMSLAEQHSIFLNGRPTPNLKNLKKKTKTCFRHFNISLYENIKWLTGCLHRNKMFCWPCTLFSKEKFNVWTQYGFDDMNNLHKASKRHECSQCHIISVIKMREYRRTRMEVQLDEQAKISVTKHNDQVKRNRDIMRRLIDITCYLGKQGLTFRGPEDGAGESLTRGNYVDLVHMLSEYDDRLQSHLENNSNCFGLSIQTQINLIDSIGTVIVNEIKRQVNSAPFVSIMMDETADVSTMSQLATVLRYTTAEGEIEERFLGFTDVSCDRTATALAMHLSHCVQEYGCTKKLVAQTYDVTSVMPGESNVLQALVREEYPSAMFVHSYAHRLNHALSQALSSIKECKIFFMTLSEFAAFFSSSSRRTSAFDQEVKKRFPKASTTNSNQHGRLVETVNKYKVELKNLFYRIMECPHEWDSATYLAAKGFHATLCDFSFIFMLKIFSSIFPETDALFENLQKNIFDVECCQKKIKELQVNLKKQQEDFEMCWSDVEEDPEVVEEPFSKRQRTEDGHDPTCDDYESGYKHLYDEIYDVVQEQLKERFENTGNLKFLELMDFSKCGKYKKFFPDDALNSLKSSYGILFDLQRLRNELCSVYSITELNSMRGINEILKYLKETELDETLPELCKLCELMLTIPATPASAVAPHTTMKRIRSYLRASTGPDRLSMRAVIAIEKRLLCQLMKQPNFYDEVTGEFCKRESKIELLNK